MKDKNRFDIKLEVSRAMPQYVKDAAVHVADHLDIAWAAVEAVFGSKAKPEHAVQLLSVLMARSDAERQRTLDEARAQMAPSSTPPAAPRRGSREGR